MKKIKIPWFGLIVTLLFSATLIGMLHYRTSHIKGVSIHDQKREYHMMTYGKSVQEVLDQAGITLGPHDEIHPDLDTLVKNEMIIDIRRAYQLTVIDQGDVYQVFTTERIVEKILKKENIELGSLDMVEPFIGASMDAGGQITITRVQELYDIQEYQIPFVTEVIFDPDLPDDETVLVQEGQPGIKEVKLKLRYENGQLVARHFVDEVVVKEPINTLKNKGVENMFVTSRGIPFRYSKMIICEATAYDLSYESCGKYPGDPAYGITFSGTKARPGVIAVDPRIIPLGTKVYIESLDYTADYGFAIAEDTGSAIKGYRVDLFIGSNREALRYGRRNVRVYILDDHVDDELIKGYGY